MDTLTPSPFSPCPQPFESENPTREAVNGGDQAALNPSLSQKKKKPKLGMAFLTQESVGNVLGHLVAGAAHLGQVCELPVQHPLEL